MLRTNSKWTLRVRKPVTKKSICHWVWLGSARKSARGQLWRRDRAPQRWTYLEEKKDLQRPQTEPTMGSRRVGLPWACEPTAWRVRSEGYPCSLHQSRNAPSKCFERRAPRSVPNTAPDPPLPPGLGYPSGARRHTEPRSRFSSWTVGECGVQKTPT